MSTCILNGGHSLGCRSTGGGSTKLWLASFSATTVWTADANYNLTGCTGYNTFYLFEAPVGTISATEEVVGSIENYNVAINQTVTSMLQGITQTDAELIQLMGQYPLYAIVKHANGNFYLFGYENGLWMNAATRNFGKAKTDAVGINFTLSGQEDVLAPVVSAALATTLSIS